MGNFSKITKMITGALADVSEIFDASECSDVIWIPSSNPGAKMPGIDRFACITVAVKDQDEALRWFTEKLGFVKRVDMPGPGIRFLSVSPKNQPELQVILASWFPDHVGRDPTAVLHTGDCRKTWEELRERGVEFTEEPEQKPFGLQAVFRDLYGNSYALLEPGRRG
jgi:catechol 2,3-dioxygenase-like lactoylglutathione lyase family enzyme